MSTHPYAARPIAGSHVWLTPPEIVAALGPFDLDPCAAPSPRPWPTATQHIELPECGLAAKWEGRVWCNPPFGSQAGDWLEKMAAHGDGIALTFARTETATFQRHVWPHIACALFLAKRPHFYRPNGFRAKGNSGGPIVLLAYGGRNAQALQSSGLPGALVLPMGVAA